MGARRAARALLPVPGGYVTLPVGLGALAADTADAPLFYCMGFATDRPQSSLSLNAGLYDCVSLRSCIQVMKSVDHIPADLGQRGGD